MAASETSPDGFSLKAACLSAVRSSRWRLGSDIWVMLAAISIPWSTSAVSIFTAIWCVTLVPMIKPDELRCSMRRPACYLPVAIFALAVVGTLWADGPWRERFLGIGPTLKLLAIPLLINHFAGDRGRGRWVFVGFLVSCTLLMVLSWIVLWDPSWRISTTDVNPGLPLKNAISQNQEFALCAFGLASVACIFWRQNRLALAAAAAFLMLAFLCNILFAALARTALLYLLVLAVLFFVWHFGRRIALWLPVGAVVLATAVWLLSPHVRERVEHIAVEYSNYTEKNYPTSTGQRLAYWQMSAKWIGEAPILGHGTGSTKRLFAGWAAGKTDAWGQLISNPHNQTLYVAIQWGVLGSLILFAMWFSHVRLFRGTDLASWIGLIVVVQNITSSLLNSHLFDFHEGWIYVVGVGVAGGLRQAVTAGADKDAA